MRAFAEAWAEETFVQALLTWYHYIAEYSLRDISKPIGVSEYQLAATLPES
jgi:hypothetical protein